MSHSHPPPNPYITGRPVPVGRPLFGRQELIERVAADLRTAEAGVVVLLGERLIGKTSVLLHLVPTLSAGGFAPVYYDLLRGTQRPTEQTIVDLVAALAQVSAATPANRPPVLLLDQLDLVEADAAGATAALCAGLRRMAEDDPRLGMVFAIGGCVEDLPLEARALLKGARSHRVGLLDEGSARALIHSARQDGVLVFKEEGADRVLALTGGHPHFIQLICQLLCEEAYAGEPHIIHKVDAGTVERVLGKVLAVGEQGLEWIWSGLLPLERLVVATIARAVAEGAGLGREALGEALRSQGSPPPLDVDLTLAALVERQVLRQRGSGHGITVDLLRRWAARRRVEGISREGGTLGDRLFRAALDLRGRGDVEGAQAVLRQALRTEPDHGPARQQLAELLLDTGQPQDALALLEQGDLTAPTAKALLLEVLLGLGEALLEAGDEAGALSAFQRAQVLAPDDPRPFDLAGRIWVRRGDAALREDALDRAEAAYREAGHQEGLRAVEARRRRLEIERFASQAQHHVWQEEWKQAIEGYERLAAQEPEEDRWKEALGRVRAELELSQMYSEGTEALRRGDRLGALRALAGVVHRRADYKDAAAQLAQLCPRPPAPPLPPPRGAWLRGLTVGTCIGLLGVGVVAATGARRNAARGGAPTTSASAPLRESPEAAAARLLLEAGVAAAEGRWEEAIARADQVLKLEGAGPAARRVAAAEKERAMQERLARAAYQDFLAVDGSEAAEKIGRYQRIPAESLYRRLARGEYDKALLRFVEDRLTKAEAARAAGRCGDMHLRLGEVLALDPGHADALEAQRRPCRDATPRRPAAPGGKRETRIGSVPGGLGEPSLPAGGESAAEPPQGWADL